MVLNWLLLQFLLKHLEYVFGFYSEKNQDGKRTFTENLSSYINRRGGSVDPNRVLQEPFEWYDKCNKRPRNKGKLLYITTVWLVKKKYLL